VVSLWYLTDSPERAPWLPEDERAWLVEAMRRDRADASRPTAHNLRAGLIDPAVWSLAFSLFLVVTSGYGFSFFLPQIVKGFSGLSDLRVGAVTAVPFLVAAIGMVTAAAHFDRTRARRWHDAACGYLAAASLASASIVPT